MALSTIYRPFPAAKLIYRPFWERLYNPNFKGVEFDPLLAEAGSNSFTMSPTRWVELTAATGIITKNGAGCFSCILRHLL
jgi:hypothetical protein